VESLESYYGKAEQEITWPEEPALWAPKQFYWLVKDLRAQIRERSLAEKLPDVIYEQHLYDMLGFVSELRSALNDHPFTTDDKRRGIVWKHRSSDDLLGLNKNAGPSEIDRTSLLGAAAKYLSNPWLQNDQIDWTFIDALMYAEISAYRESIVSGRALGKINWAYTFSGGNIKKVLLLQWAKLAASVVLRYVLPVSLIAVLYFRQHENEAFIVGAVYAAYLLLRLVLWPLRYRKRKAQERTMKEHTDRLQKMIDAYYYCNPPVVSLGTLQTYIGKAVDAGAIFEGALFSILAKVMAAKGDVLMPFKETA
jgi:hypothetical protein